MSAEICEHGKSFREICRQCAGEFPLTDVSLEKRIEDLESAIVQLSRLIWHGVPMQPQTAQSVGELSEQLERIHERTPLASPP